MPPPFMLYPTEAHDLGRHYAIKVGHGGSRGEVHTPCSLQAFPLANLGAVPRRRETEHQGGVRRGRLRLVLPDFEVSRLESRGGGSGRSSFSGALVSCWK